LNAPQATFAAKIEAGDDGSFTVERETDAGECIIFVSLFHIITHSFSNGKNSWFDFA
jgi:electron transfer flavoprotein alpha/beta subunit